MVSRLLIGLLFAFTLCQVRAQTYFNRRIDLFNNYNECFSILKMNEDTFFLNGTSNDSLSWHFNANMIMIDSLGNVIKKKAFKRDTAMLLSYSRRNNLVWDTGEILSLTCLDPLNGNTNGAIIRFNTVCDTISTVVFGDTSHFLDVTKITKDKGGWLVAASETVGKLPYDSFGDFYYRFKLYKFDTALNILWSNVYGLSTLTQICTDMIKSSTGDCYLFGYKVGTSAPTASMMLVKTDSLGNKRWIKYYNNFTNPFNSLTELHDGSILLGTITLDSVSSNFAMHYTRSNLIKIDTAGNILWSKFYQYPANGNLTITCKELSNHDLLVLGTEGGIYMNNCATQYARAYVMKTDSAGNIIFYRTYTGDQNDTNAYSYLYDVIEMKDKGYLAVGGVWPQCDGTTIDGWILRVDSSGCEMAGGCASYTTVIDLRDSGIVIYPNPVRDVFSVKSEDELGLIRLYNHFGQTIREFTVNDRQVEIDLRGFAAGLYILQTRGEFYRIVKE